MIFRTALSQGMRVGCITMTRNRKASHLNSVTPLLPERKNSRLNLLLEYYAHHFLELQRHHSPEVHSQRHKYQLWEWHEVEQTNQSHLSDKKPMLLEHDNAKPHSCSAILVMIALNLKLFHALPVAWIWLLVVCSSQETSQKNSFHMWSCYGEILSRRAWSSLQWQVWKTCSHTACKNMV